MLNRVHPLAMILLIPVLIHPGEAGAVVKKFFPIATSTCELNQLDPATGAWKKVKTPAPETVDVEKTWTDSFGDENSQFKSGGNTYSIQSRCLQAPGLASDFRASIPIARIRAPYLVFMGGYHRYGLTLRSQSNSYALSKTTYSATFGLGRDWMLLPFLFTRVIGTVNFDYGRITEVGTTGNYPNSTSLGVGGRARVGLGWLVWSHGMLAVEGGGFANYEKFPVPSGFNQFATTGTVYNVAFDVMWRAARFFRIEAGYLSIGKEPFYNFGYGFGL
ncbi:MAG: hypothetical protein EBX52_08360 [Proteobacteria bacterium]|nr:hypothetical protein [Pseudomonadota bacterium]